MFEIHLHRKGRVHIIIRIVYLPTYYIIMKRCGILYRHHVCGIKNFAKKKIVEEKRNSAAFKSLPRNAIVFINSAVASDYVAAVVAPRGESAGGGEARKKKLQRRRPNYYINIILLYTSYMHTA